MGIHYNKIIEKSRVVWIVISLFSVSVQASVSVDNESLFSVVISLLEGGKTVTITATGVSMMPTIENGAKVLLEKREVYETGDIVLAHLSSGKYVLHRIRAKMGKSVVLKGDANMTEEYCPLDSIKAYGSKIEDSLIPVDIAQPLDTPMIEHRRWKINPMYYVQKIGDATFLLPRQVSHVDLSSAKTFNETAEFVYTSMKGRIFSLNDCVNVLLQEYDVDRQTATLDCVNLLITWYTLGIIEVK